MDEYWNPNGRMQRTVDIVLRLSLTRRHESLFIKMNKLKTTSFLESTCFAYQETLIILMMFLEGATTWKA